MAELRLSDITLLEVDDDFIEHYGVKGMRWGVRRKDPARTALQALDVGNGESVIVSYDPGKLTISNNSEGTGLSLVGDKDAVADATKQIQSNRRVSQDFAKAEMLKNRAPNTMSNDDLKLLTSRLELERKLNNLTPEQISKGKKRLDTLMTVGGAAQKVVKFVNSPEGKATVSAAKKAYQKTRG